MSLHALAALLVILGWPGVSAALILIRRSFQ